MTNPNLAEIDYLRQIAAELTEAGHGKRGPIIKRACEYLTVSNAELYRRLAKVGFTSGRKTRIFISLNIIPAQLAMPTARIAQIIWRPMVMLNSQPIMLWHLV